MAGTLPTFSDCCSLCDGQTVTVTTGTNQFLIGSTDPNVAGLTPADTTQPAIYLQTVGGVVVTTWYWNPTAATWQ